MDRERRRTPRVAVAADIRIRPAGADGSGIACRVDDAAAHGFRCRPAMPIGPDWHGVEILKASGAAHAAALEARIVHAGIGDGGGPRLCCSFD